MRRFFFRALKDGEQAGGAPAPAADKADELATLKSQFLTLESKVARQKGTDKAEISGIIKEALAGLTAEIETLKASVAPAPAKAEKGLFDSLSEWLGGDDGE